MSYDPPTIRCFGCGGALRIVKQSGKPSFDGVGFTPGEIVVVRHHCTGAVAPTEPIEPTVIP